MQENNNISNITNPCSRVKLDYKDGDLLKVQFVWENRDYIHDDLDFCAFFLSKDGSVGGVFPWGYKKDMAGSLQTFPYMLLIEEHELCENFGCCSEEIWINKLSGIEKICFVAIDYYAATNGIDAKFSEDSFLFILKKDNKKLFQSYLNSSSEGCVYSICSIVNETDGLYVCNNDNLVMDLATAFEHIPGFSTICNN